MKREPLVASGLGEHLECSPCGNVASRALVSRLAGPGGAAVALAIDGFYQLVVAFDQFLWDEPQLFTSLEQGLVALHGRGVCGGLRDGLFHLRI